jgi:hypothetical protein
MYVARSLGYKIRAVRHVETRLSLLWNEPLGPLLPRVHRLDLGLEEPGEAMKKSRVNDEEAVLYVPSEMQEAIRRRGWDWDQESWWERRDL